MFRLLLDCVMGNCLKSSTSDDVSLLREGAHNSQSADQLAEANQSPPPYIDTSQV